MNTAKARLLVEKIKSDSDFCKNLFSIKDKGERLKFIAESGYGYIGEEIEKLRDNCAFYITPNQTMSMGCDCYHKKCFGPWCPSRCDEDGGNYGEGCGM